MHGTYEAEAVESAISIRRIFVAIELSKSTWVVAIQPPAVDKVSLFRIPGGDIEKLSRLMTAGGVAKKMTKQASLAVKSALADGIQRRRFGHCRMAKIR